MSVEHLEMKYVKLGSKPIERKTTKGFLSTRKVRNHANSPSTVSQGGALHGSNLGCSRVYWDDL